jgi:hypothetical protein
MGGKSHTFSSKGEEQEYLIQLRCWKNSEIKNIRPQDRYLQTYASVNMQVPEDSKMHKHDADDSYRSRRSYGQRWFSLGKELSL